MPRWPASSLVLLLACEATPSPDVPSPAAPSHAVPSPDVPSPDVPSPAMPSPDVPSPDTRKRACLDQHLPHTEPDFHPLMRSLCALWIDHELPGLAVALVERGELRFHVELGRRCLDRPEPVTPTTALRIGSISKPITATLLLERLPAEALAAPVELPGLTWPPGMPTPTLDALLRHRSGLGEIDPSALVDVAGDWQAALARSPAAGEPGSWRYANAGYVIAGALLEARTALTYEALLRARVGESSTLTSDPTRPRELACGHLREAEALRPIAVTDDLDFMPGDPSWLRPAGGVLGSAEDLARLAPTLAAPMFEPGAPLPREAWRHAGHDERDGLGLRSWTLTTGQRVFGHAGDTGTFAAELVIVPERELALVMLANATTSWAEPRLAFEQWLTRQSSP